MSNRGSILMMVLIFSVIISIIGLATINYNCQNEITAINEVNVSRANFLADAGLEWGKVWISSQCVNHNMTPQDIAHHSNLFEIGRVDPAQLQDKTITGRGFFTVGILPVATSTGTYMLISTGTVSSGIWGNSTFKTKAILFKLESGNGTFSATGSMITGRYAHTATLLKTGEVLILGGYNAVIDPPIYWKDGTYYTSELYNPETGTFRATLGSLNRPRAAHTATLLDNGDVLIAGGVSDNGRLDNPNDPMAVKPEIYHPETETFTPTIGSMIHPRSNHCATLITAGKNKGKVLIAGGTRFQDWTFTNMGWYWYGNQGSNEELYDPKDGSFTSTDFVHGIKGGDVAISTNGTIFFASARSLLTYNPFTGHFSELDVGVSDNFIGRRGSATFLSGAGPNNGKVIFFGVLEPSYGTRTFFYDTGTNSCTPIGATNTSRGHTATLLNNGKVLFAGGTRISGGGLTNTAEVFDPNTCTFTQTGNNMMTARYYHAATLLNNGRVLITGGAAPNAWSNPLSTAELYGPIMDFKVLDNSYIEW